MDAGRPMISPTPLGRLVLALAIGGLVIGGFSLSAVPLLAGLLGLSVWLLERSRTARSLDGLRAVRSLPSNAWTGRSFALETRLERPARHPGACEIVFRDPLASRLDLSIDFPAGAFTRTVRYPGRCDRRGRFRPAGWTATSPGPLGWFETSHIGSFETPEPARRPRIESIDVVPAPSLPPRLLRYLEGKFAAGHHVTGFPDPVAEFRLLREFRHGDPIRGIHWPATLRTGELLVREPDPPRPAPNRFGILLHSFEPPGELFVPESFERILRIVSGLLHRLRRTGVETRLLQAGGDMGALRHESEYRNAIRELATLQRIALPDPEPIRSAADAFPDCDEIFVLGDAALALWESSVRPAFDRAHCIDPAALSLSPVVPGSVRKRPRPLNRPGPAERRVS